MKIINTLINSSRLLVISFIILCSTQLSAEVLEGKDNQQSQITITGVVVDKETKETLIGVSVMVRGTGEGTATDLDGNFTIKVPYAEATLAFSYVGYASQTVELKGQKNIKVELVEDSKALDEVVVVGYRTQKRENITGAVSTITTKDLVQSPTANINNALAGRLPGLLVNQFSGGEPGVDKAQLLIRGKSTYGDQSPIVIVDGIERDMSYLAADEIETFTILKDASSTAPYGIRGANGVIVITTKRGQASEKATVNFKASAGFNQVGKKPNLLGSADYATLYNEALRNDALMNGQTGTPNGLFSDESIANFRKSKGDNSDGLGYDWDYFDYMLKSAFQQNYNLSVRGGGKTARYYVMAGYSDQGTNYKHVDLSQYDTSPKFKKYNFRSNIDVDITKYFWVKLDLGARITDRTNIGSSAGRLMNFAMTQPPYLPIVLEQNDNAANQDFQSRNPDGMLFGDQIYRYNLLGELSRSGYHTQKYTYLEGSFTLGHKLDFITEGLRVEATFSYDAREEQWVRREVPGYSEGYRAYPGYATFRPDEGTDIYKTPGNGLYQGKYVTGNKYDSDQTVGNKFDQSNPANRTYYQAKLIYERAFNEKHNVSGLMLFNRSTEGMYDGGKVRADHRYQGVTGQFAYNFATRYFGEFNFGYNGSENFAKSKRYGFFPAGSIGWVVTNEKFMDNTKSWLDFFKLRASYGLVGNDKLPGSRFGYLQFFQGGEGYDFGEAFNTNPGGWREGDLANTLLTWEKSKKLNIGFDSDFLKQRLRVSVDYFKEKRYDILTSLGDADKLGFPEIVGKVAPQLNIGEVDNHGIEIEITWSDKIGRDFRYFIKPNFTFARNKVKYMHEIPYAHSWRSKTGQAMDVNMLYVFDHFVRDQAEADELNAKGYQPWGTLIPGDVVYKDLDGDGKISDLNDRMAMGYPRTPEIQFGIPVTLQYKDFDFSVLFQGAANANIMLKDAAVFDFPNYDNDKIGRVRPMHLNRWTPETASTAKYPALHLGTHTNNKNPDSSLYMYDGKYIRLKNIELGYTLPNKIIRVAGLSNVRVYAQAQNLITWDKLGDIDVDPEIRNGGGDWYPILKVFNFGIDVTF